jgi:hypothetical protein
MRAAPLTIRPQPDELLSAWCKSINRGFWQRC